MQRFDVTYSLRRQTLQIAVWEGANVQRHFGAKWVQNRRLQSVPCGGFVQIAGVAGINQITDFVRAACLLRLVMIYREIRADLRFLDAAVSASERIQGADGSARLGGNHGCVFPAGPQCAGRRDRYRPFSIAAISFSSRLISVRTSVR